MSDVVSLDLFLGIEIHDAFGSAVVWETVDRMVVAIYYGQSIYQTHRWGEDSTIFSGSWLMTMYWWLKVGRLFFFLFSIWTGFLSRGHRKTLKIWLILDPILTLVCTVIGFLLPFVNFSTDSSDPMLHDEDLVEDDDEEFYGVHEPVHVHHHHHKIGMNQVIRWTREEVVDLIFAGYLYYLAWLVWKAVSMGTGERGGDVSMMMVHGNGVQKINLPAWGGQGLKGLVRYYRTQPWKRVTCFFLLVHMFLPLRLVLKADVMTDYFFHFVPHSGNDIMGTRILTYELIRLVHIVACLVCVQKEFWKTLKFCLFPFHMFVVWANFCLIALIFYQNMVHQQFLSVVVGSIIAGCFEILTAYCVLNTMTTSQTVDPSSSSPPNTLPLDDIMNTWIMMSTGGGGVTVNSGDSTNS